MICKGHLVLLRGEIYKNSNKLNVTLQTINAYKLCWGKLLEHTQLENREDSGRTH